MNDSIDRDLDRIVLEAFTPSVEWLADLLMAAEGCDQIDEAEALRDAYRLRKLVLEEVERMLGNDDGGESDELG